MDDLVENPPFKETSIYFHHPSPPFAFQAASPSPWCSQADAEISTLETKACILEQLQKETEARNRMAATESMVNGWGFMDFFLGGGGCQKMELIFTTKMTLKEEEVRMWWM